MSRICRSAVLLNGAALLVLAACSGPGLPPADPKPGEADVGYGTQPGEQVTGSVTTVSGTQLGDTRGGGIEELLRGKVAGLQITRRPEGGYRYLIRGLATGGSVPHEPLFVVDGAQVSAQNLESALSGLTRDDIRQVDVLKDVASTSIYGSRGVGGVIIINTKRR